MDRQPPDQNQARQIGRQCLCFNLRKAARLATQAYDQALKPSGLRVTQFSVLMATQAMEGAAMGQLAQALGMDRTTLTRNLDLLAQRGLVRLEQGDDRRQQRPGLTEDGRQALQRAMPLWRQAQARLGQALGPDGMDQLLAELRLLSGRLG